MTANGSTPCCARSSSSGELCGHSAEAEDSARRTVARLVVRIAGGDPAAEEELFLRFDAAVQRLVRRKGGSPTLAEDLSQETFRIVLQRLRSHGLDRPEAAGAFLFGTALNLLYAERRRMARNCPSPSTLEQASDPRGTPLTHVLAGERDKLLHSALAILVERDRQILCRFYFLGHQKEQILLDLELKPLHFNRVLFRARERLRIAIHRVGCGRARLGR
jgi:RNA polymerase sigma-70 factor (ECF subfamily)